MKLAPVKFLGIYLIAICFLQICLGFIVFLDPKDFAVLVSFAPHIGIYALERIFLATATPVFGGIFYWLTAGWFLTLGILLLFVRPLLKTYIISEIIFSLPSLVLFLALIAMVLIYPDGLKSLPVHDWILILVMVMTTFFSTLIPLVWAIWLAWRSRFRAEQ
jgi:hypothetical protein